MIYQLDDETNDLLMRVYGHRAIASLNKWSTMIPGIAWFKVDENLDPWRKFTKDDLIQHNQDSKTLEGKADLIYEFISMLRSEEFKEEVKKQKEWFDERIKSI